MTRRQSAGSARSGEVEPSHSQTVPEAPLKGGKPAAPVRPPGVPRWARRWVGLLALAAVLGLMLAWMSSDRSVQGQIAQVRLQQQDPVLARELAEQPEFVSALMLACSDDPILVAKARLAWIRYPHLAEPILLEHGDDPQFQSVLARYGEDVLLPIHYYRSHDMRWLTARQAVSSRFDEASGRILAWWTDEADAAVAGNAAAVALTPAQRGQAAIAALDVEGYDLLAQFRRNPDGEVIWLQGERVMAAVSDFFTGGIRRLEQRWREEGNASPGDIAWAATDVAIGVAAFKLLRAARVARPAGLAATGRSGAAATTTATVGRSFGTGLRIAAYGAVGTGAYLAVRHPSVLSAMFAQAAQWVGLPPWLGQWVGWTLLLIPVLWLLTWLLLPLQLMLGGMRTGVGWLRRLVA